MIFRDRGPSEDCLTLNIWAPTVRPRSGLPVMVWIHGGGFVLGSSSEPRQDGAKLAASHQVIVVSMNYRLGIFGFFAHPELEAESLHHASGNYGLLDQVAALEWVHENIAALGGAPDNVTIFGESAGSYSVSILMASPLGKGLFQRAIGESGGAFPDPGHAFATRLFAEKQGAAFAHAELAADTLAELRSTAAEHVLAASTQDGASRFPITPDVDGYLLPRSVIAIFAAGQQNDVPLLAGWNRDEGGVRTEVRKSAFVEDVRAVYAANASEVLDLYPAADDAGARLSATALASDRFIGFSTWRWIEAQSHTGHQPVYRYRFDHVAPADRFHPDGVSAYHSSEIPYVFGTFGLLPKIPYRPEDVAVSEFVQQYWTNFASTGDPNRSLPEKTGSGQRTSPEWPRYAPGTRWQVLTLNSRPVVAPDPVRAREQRMQTILELIAPATTERDDPKRGARGQR